MAVNIDRSLRLPEAEYFRGAQLKSGIAIHHTVGGTAESTVQWWLADRTNAGRPRQIGTAYIVARDGTIHEVFDPAAWAYQFGLTWPVDARLRFERRFVGIELASAGGLLERDGQLYCFDRVSYRTRRSRAQAFDHGQEYRGYRWFDRYPRRQLDSLARLVDELCARFDIPRRYPDPPFDYYGDALSDFAGVIGHAMVRPDKSDPAPDPRLWETLADLAGLRPVLVTTPGRGDGAPLSSREVEELFASNVRRIDAMDVAAGSLVKALLLELERRRTYLALAEPEPGAHAIGYEILQGDRDDVNRVALALGFRRVTETMLEVHDV